MDDDIGLMDYKARFRVASPVLNRFIQPDSIVPDPANPQALNRYSYVYNRPIVFNDPSGHDPWWCPNSGCVNKWTQNQQKNVSGWTKNIKLKPKVEIPNGVPAPNSPNPTSTPQPNSSLLPSSNNDPDNNTPSQNVICTTPMPGATGCEDRETTITPYPYSQTINLGFDPKKVDWIDVFVGIFGIIGDGSKFFGPPGMGIWVLSQMAEISVVAKDWDELDAGDPLGVGFELADKGADLGELHPVYGFVFNVGDILYNLGSGITVTVNIKPNPYIIQQ